MHVVSKSVHTAQHSRHCSPGGACRLSFCCTINCARLLGDATFKVQKVAASFEKKYTKKKLVLTVFRDPLHFFFVAGDPIIPRVSGGAAAAPRTAQWAEWQRRRRRRGNKRTSAGNHSFFSLFRGSGGRRDGTLRCPPSPSEQVMVLRTQRAEPTRTPRPPLLAPPLPHGARSDRLSSYQTVFFISLLWLHCVLHSCCWELLGSGSFIEKMLVMKNFRITPLNLTVATLYQLDAVHAGNLLFLWCISDFTSLQMFYFEQFLKLVLTSFFFFAKRGKMLMTTFFFPLGQDKILSGGEVRLIPSRCYGILKHVNVFKKK